MTNHDRYRYTVTCTRSDGRVTRSTHDHARALTRIRWSLGEASIADTRIEREDLNDLILDYCPDEPERETPPTRNSDRGVRSASERGNSPFTVQSDRSTNDATEERR